MFNVYIYIYTFIYIYIHTYINLMGDRHTHPITRVANTSAAGLGHGATHIADGHHLPISDRRARASRLHQHILPG